jgi:hypothetical protein
MKAINKDGLTLRFAFRSNKNRMNPNPNPKDVGVLPRRHVGSAILDHHDGLREGHWATAHPPMCVSSGRHKRAPPRDSSTVAHSPSGECHASASGLMGGAVAHRQQPRVVRPDLGLGHCRERFDGSALTFG